MTSLPIGTPGVYDVGAMEAFVHRLPAAQQQAALVLTFNLVRISGYANNFCAAVSLLEFTEIECNKLNQAVPKSSITIEIARILGTLELWAEMGARDAAMTIFHFSKTLDAIRACLKDLPSVNGDVEHNKLREAAKRFRSEFPNAEKARHGVAHQAEITASLDSIKANSVAGNLVFGALKGRIYTVTNEGKHHSLSITKQSHYKLVEIVDSVFKAFPSIVEDLPPVRRLVV